MIRSFRFIATLSFCAFASFFCTTSHGQTLLHYWNFNKLGIVDTFPKIPLLKADYSLIDTNKAYMLYTFIPGTTTTRMNQSWIDSLTPGTTVNAQQGAAAGTCLRARNPVDSALLWFYIPTTGYAQGVNFSFALESSSVKSGPEVLVFNYSIDSGLHWKTNNITVNGSNVDTLNTKPSVYQGSSFGLITVGLTDSTVHNNSKLVLSIGFKRDDTGAVTGTSGNVRLDNISITTIPLTPTITISRPSKLDTIISAAIDTIRYTTSGIVSRQKTYSYSLDSGATWNTIATDTGIVLSGGYGYVWTTVPTVINPNPKVIIRAVDSAGTTGYSSAFTVIPVPRTIVISHPGSDTLYSGKKDTILYKTTGIVSRKKSYFYSLDSGRTWNMIGYDTGIVIGGGVFGKVWTVPLVYDPSSRAIIAISDSAEVIGYSSLFTLLPFPMGTPPANLIHYWHFNQVNGVYNYTSAPPMSSDYSAVGKGGISFQLDPGTSPYSYPGIITDTFGTSQDAQLGYPGGQALKIENPSDSVQVLFYIPTTNHENIQVHYALQTSRTYRGPVIEQFDYSIDSGLTWRTTALKQTSDTIDIAPYAGGWGNITVDLSSDLLASDNPNLVFRLRFAGNNSSSLGYVAIDNFSVTGPVGQVTIPGVPTLVHYWNFNKLAGPYIHPNIPNIKADFSLLDTNKAYLEYYLLPGTSATWAFANNAGGAQVDNVASTDTTNLRQGAPSGTGLRCRNPVDSSELHWHIPSTGYSNLVITFATQSSSTTSGDSAQIYTYSVDGGTTWKPVATVNGAPGNTLDLTQGGLTGPYLANFGKVVITFGSDAAVNNNPNLIFRIVCKGNTSLLSGNNRYDDFTVDGSTGTSSVNPPPQPGLITSVALDGFTSATPVDTIYGGTVHTISYSTSGGVTPARNIEYTIDGVSWYPVANNVTTTSYSWKVPVIPLPATSRAYVRVIDGNGVEGTSPRFVILDSGKIRNITMAWHDILVGQTVPILWVVGGYVGPTVTIDISNDSGKTWTNVVSNDTFGYNDSYKWTAPMTPDSNFIVRLTFPTTGLVGYSKPFAVSLPPAGVSEPNATKNSLRLWPNPIAFSTTLKYSLPESGNVTLSLRDVTGREVETIPEGLQAAGDNQLKFDASQLPNGVYLLDLTSGSTVYRGRIVVLH